jgi:ABC-type transport system substrate-binding protein
MTKSKITKNPLFISPLLRGRCPEQWRGTKGVVLLSILVILLLAQTSLASTNEAQIKSYDGLWFLGFNMHKDIFGNDSGLSVRKAFNMAIDRAWIAKNIVHDDVVPNGPTPPSMLGYDPLLKDYPYDLSKAKALMVSAGYPTNDKRLKELSLLHTDGEKTVEIAKWIKRYLINLGVDLKLVQVKYSDYDAWEKELSSGKHHMFLMGYKPVLFDQILIGDKDTKLFHTVNCSRIPSAEAQEFFGSYTDATEHGYSPCEICKPEKEGSFDAYDLLEPLFHSKGDANLTFYSNSRVDSLLDQLGEIDHVLKASRAQKLKDIASILVEDPPGVNIFYITKL